MLNINLVGMEWEENKFNGGASQVMSFNDGFLIVIYFKILNSFLSRKSLLFVEPSGVTSLVDMGKYHNPDLGLSKAKSSILVTYKNPDDDGTWRRTRQYVKGPEGSRFISDWDICTLSEDNKSLVLLEKDLHFRSKDTTVSKISFCKNRVLVSGSSLRKKPSLYIINQMFGNIQVRPRQVLIGNIDNGFPLDHKLLDLGKEILDCSISNDGLTGCLLLANKSRNLEEIAIIDL